MKKKEEKSRIKLICHKHVLLLQKAIIMIIIFIIVGQTEEKGRERKERK